MDYNGQLLVSLCLLLCGAPSQDTFASLILVNHSRSDILGKGFPWQSAPLYPVRVPEPSLCFYTADLEGQDLFFDGKVEDFKSPVLLEGTAIDFVVDALLTAPIEAADTLVKCSAFQPSPARNATMAPGPAHKRNLPSLTRPRMGSATQQSASAHSDDQPEPVSWHTEGYEDHSPGDHEEGTGYSGYSNSRLFKDFKHNQEGSNSGGSYGGYGKDDPKPPSPPVAPLNYTSSTSFEVLLLPFDVNATGHLTQKDFETWGKDRMFGPKRFLLLRPGCANSGRRQMLNPSLVILAYSTAIPTLACMALTCNTGSSQRL